MAGRPRKLTPEEETAQAAAIAEAKEINTRALRAQAEADKIVDNELKPVIRRVLALTRDGPGNQPLVTERRLANAIGRDRGDLRRWRDEPPKSSTDDQEPNDTNKERGV